MSSILLKIYVLMYFQSMSLNNINIPQSAYTASLIQMSQNRQDRTKDLGFLIDNPLTVS